MQLVEGITGLW